MLSTFQHDCKAIKSCMRLQINQLSEADKLFKQFLQDPSVPKKEKLSSLGEILKEMKVSETTSSLFGEPLYTARDCHARGPFPDAGLVVTKMDACYVKCTFLGGQASACSP